MGRGSPPCDLHSENLCTCVSRARVHLRGDLWKWNTARARDGYLSLMPQQDTRAVSNHNTHPAEHCEKFVRVKFHIRCVCVCVCVSFFLFALFREIRSRNFFSSHTLWNHVFRVATSKAVLLEPKISKKFHSIKYFGSFFGNFRGLHLKIKEILRVRIKSLSRDFRFFRPPPPVTDRHFWSRPPPVTGDEDFFFRIFLNFLEIFQNFRNFFYTCFRTVKFHEESEFRIGFERTASKIGFSCIWRESSGGRCGMKKIEKSNFWLKIF